MAGTVTVTGAGAAQAGGSIAVYVLTGAASTQNGATASLASAVLTNITPGGTGSFIAVSPFGISGAPYTANGNTTLDLNAGEADGTQRLAGHSTSAPTSGVSTPYGCTTTATKISIVLAEILASGTIAIDASSPAAVYNNGAASATTASFTPPAGAIFVAEAVTNGGAGVSTASVTDTLGLSLTWTEMVKVNGAGQGYNGIWVGLPPAGAPSGKVQPAATLAGRRRPSRGVAGGIAVPPLRPGVSSQLVSLPRRASSRAFVMFRPVRTVNVLPASVAGKGQPPATVPVPRRAAFRGLWRGLAGPPPASGPAARPRPPVPRRYPARALWRGSISEAVETGRGCVAVTSQIIGTVVITSTGCAITTGGPLVTYLSGSLVRSTASFTNVNGAAADPTTVTLKYSAFGGPVVTVVYPAAPILRDSAGVYHADLDTSGLLGGASQQFTVEWKGTGAVQAIGTDMWNILSDPF